MTKYGVLVNGSMTVSQKISIVESLGVQYVRDAINISLYPTIPASYAQYIAASKKVVVNLNWASSGSGPVPFPTNMTLYASKLTSVLNDIAAPELCVIENEEINDTYHSGPLSDYVTMLQTASPIIHGKGYKLCNGGVYGTGLYILTFRYLKATYGQSAADAFGVILTPAQYHAANVPGSNPTMDALATDVQTVLDGVALYCDYVNIHPYEDLNKNHDLTQQAALISVTPGTMAYLQEYVETYTGVPCITNETGQRNNTQPALVTSMLQTYYDLGFPYVIWFNGTGSAGATPLNDQSFPFALLPNGEAYLDFMRPMPTITPDSAVIALPTNMYSVTATGLAHSGIIVAKAWSLFSGPTTYTISAPDAYNTDFTSLIGGTYIFRLMLTNDLGITGYADFSISVSGATTQGVRYIIRFKNRQTIDGVVPAGDICRVTLTPDDYSGINIELEGGDRPFVLKYQSGDGDIYSAIKASEAVIQFWTNGNVSLNTFYNDEATFWTVHFYSEQISGETAVDLLLWTGFLQLDNSGEDLQDRAHLITLNANDNLGLLKNIALPAPTAEQIYEGILLTELFKIILQQTSLFLDTNAYLNIFENSTDDRSDSDTADCLQQTAVYTNNLQNSDGTYRNCFDILNDILTSFRATLFQCFGAWTIVRQGEFRLFADAAVPGTNYNPYFIVGGAITLDPKITIGRNLKTIPINENQIKRILRPLKFAKRTFNFNQPAEIIVQSDLHLPVGATPYATNTVGDFRYDDYDLATYFPAWLQTHGDTSYLEVVTDTTTNNEKERYIVTPASGHAYKGVQFNNIPVSANDSFDFSLSLRTFTDSSDNFTFTIRFILVTADGFYYNLTIFPGVGSTVNVHWTGPFAVAGWDSFAGDPLTVLASSNSAQWTPWSLSSFVEENGRLPLIPADGILLIEVRGNNSTNLSEPEVTTLWNNINLDFTNPVNQFSNIIAQVHTQTQVSNTKNNIDEQINYDDSPRNTINGTFLRTPIVDFDANIDQLYFYKTVLWHRVALSESLRLNQINTFDELFIQRKVRTIIEGDFYGLRYGSAGNWKYISMQNILMLNFLESLNFIIGIAEFDFMAAQFTATLYELFDDGEVDGDLSNIYDFKYIYKSNQ